MEEADADVVLFSTELPDLYAILGGKSEIYDRRVANLLKVHPKSVADLMSRIIAPTELRDYNSWEMYTDEFNNRLQEIYGVDDTTSMGRIGYAIRTVENYNYQDILYELVEDYEQLYGQRSVPIRDCISVRNTAKSISTAAHNVTVLQDIESIMSTVAELRAGPDYKSTSPYDALFNIRPLNPTEGAISTVYLLQYMDSIPMIMKTNPKDYNYQLHEYVVGVVMNSLRPTIANFVYTYGYSTVLDPITTDDDEVVSFGLYSTGTWNSQVYIEYLKNAVTLADTSPDLLVSVVEIVDGFPRTRMLSGGDVFEVLFLQLMSALYYAWKVLGFAHRDLNLGNVMLVNLNQVMAVPVMVPSAVDENTGSTRFVRRWLLTDILVVVIDYGYSSIRNDGRLKGKYPDRIISPITAYYFYEGTTTIENDFAVALRNLYRKFKISDTEMADILSMFYTGQPATEDVKSKASTVARVFRALTGGSYIYPELPFYLEKTLIKYCVKYANKWTSNSYNDRLFRSVVDRPDSTLTSYEGIINDSRSAYLALLDKGSIYTMNWPDIVDNKWYRDRYIAQSIKDTKDVSADIAWNIRFYKWTSIFMPWKLNMSPLQYNSPVDFLVKSFRAKYRRDPTENELNRYMRTGARIMWR